MQKIIDSALEYQNQNTQTWIKQFNFTS
jgi:hypothetical protein